MVFFFEVILVAVLNVPVRQVKKVKKDKKNQFIDMLSKRL